ncbi:MAG: EAL domain-containing protein [Pseudomonadota bacterium]|nr:EAL domain-containing protein [Pseudomonadota bacterium]
MNQPDSQDKGANPLARQLARRLRAVIEDEQQSVEIRHLAMDALQAWQQAEESSRIEHSRYRSLMDAVPDPVTILDWDGTVLDFNRAGCKLFGHQREHVIGKNINVLNPELPEGHMGPVIDALSRGESYVIEVTNMRADGSRFPVEVHSASIQFGTRRSIVAVARDLTARSDTDDRYTDLLESIDQGIVVQNREGQVLHINNAAMRILDLEPGTSPTAAFHGGDWEIFDERGCLLSHDQLPSSISLTTGQVVSNQVIGISRRDKHLFRWLSVSAIPKFHANADQPGQTFSLIRDITELKRDSAMFSRVQSLAAIGAWEFNRESGHIYLTSGAMRLLGIDSADVPLENMLRAFVQPYRDQLRTSLGATEQPAHAFRYELLCKPSSHGAEWLQIQGDIDPLDPAGNRITGTIADISERKQVEARLRQQALTDPMTGLFNREAIIGEIEFRLAESRLDFAILYIDLDRFKVINDVLGHHVGDELLCKVSHRVQTGIGESAVLARLGGDEFLALCPHHTANSAISIAERIIEVLSKPFQLGNEEYLVSASIGIAQAGINGDEASTLIQNADAAMYDSKRRTFNGWQCYSEDLARRQRDRLRIDTLLRSAISNNEMRLEYQPKIDLASGAVVGAEALMRWENPLLGSMSPNVFISHAEGNGEVVRLGNWALHQVCQQIRRWRDAGLDVMPIAVNVSFRQFLVGDLASTVAEALNSAGIAGSLLELEFTERVLIEDEPETLRTIARLGEMGVSLSIDDFGEGYSALNYLRRLPIHGLKLSQLFLQGVPDNRPDVAVCEAVSGIANSLGLGLVAEGVETTAQRDFLLKLGVPVGQGFLFSRPLSAEDFAAHLAAANVLGRGAA